MDPGIFFPSSKDKDCNKNIKRAQKICQVCPVKIECLTHAIVNNESYGIWGGMTERRISRLRNEIGDSDEDFVSTYLKIRILNV